MAGSTPTDKSINEHWKEGFGQGIQAEYKPWIPRQRGPRGTDRYQIPGIKIQRAYVLFGSLERDYFWGLEWLQNATELGNDIIVDIREQFPLWPYTETVEIAEQCGCPHPRYPRSSQPIVMTSDFCITLQKPNGKQYDVIRTIKPTPRLEKQTKTGTYSVLQKFEIDRRYWKKRGGSWGIVTEREINGTFATNLRLIREYYKQTKQLADLTEIELMDIASVLTALVKNNPRTPLRELAHTCDHQLGFSSHTTLGTSISTAYHLIANRYWIVDLYTRFDIANPIHILSSEKLND